MPFKREHFEPAKYDKGQRLQAQTVNQLIRAAAEGSSSFSPSGFSGPLGQLARLVSRMLFRRVQFTEDLAVGESATANLLEWAGDGCKQDAGTLVEVHDATGLTAAEGDKCYAVFMPDRGEWELVGGTAGARVIRFEILAAGPFLGEMAVECDSVRAEVLDVSCGGAGVNVGDEVSVWDPSRCHFNIPVEMLLGAHGTAVQVENDLEGIVDCYDALKEEGECLWVVQSLCCIEDVYGV